MTVEPPSPPLPTPRAAPRRQAIVSLVLLAAIVGLLYLLFEIRSSSARLTAVAGAACRGDPVAAAELRRAMYWLLALVPASTYAFAAYVAVLGRRAMRTGLFPPPGMFTIRPVRTFTGALARRSGAVMLGLAAILALLATALTAIGLRILALLNR